MMILIIQSLKCQYYEKIAILCESKKNLMEISKEIFLQQQISKNLKKVMRILGGIRQAVKMGDFFNSYQMLRFQGESEYRTFTGGMISIAIIITIIIAFASMILETVNRTTINYTHNSIRNSDPSLSLVNASPEGMFMFAVEVWGYNLSSTNRYFDVTFYQTTSNYGQNYTQVPYSLQPCTQQHWSILPEVVNKFDILSAGNWLCPSIGTVIELQGKYSSGVYTQTEIHLDICSNATDPNRPCAPIEEINEYISTYNYFTFYHVNSVVNADQPSYKSYFLEDRAYFAFDSENGAEMGMYLKETDITSDNSVWPFQDNSQDTLYSIGFPPIMYPYKIDNGTSLGVFYVMKDGASQAYSRQVQKIFVVFSFMGGLIGAIMAGMFIVNSYTSFSYQIALAIHVFKDNKETKTHKQLKEASEGSINILSFVQNYIYRFVKRFKPDCEWPFMDYIQECREEITYQLNIKGLIRRMIFLQYAISYMLEDYQLSEMQQQKPILPADVKRLRQKIEAKQDDANESKSANSNKPFFLEPDLIIESVDKNNISTKSEFGTNKNPLDLKSQQRLRVSKRFSDQSFIVNMQEGATEVKRLQNLRKIRDSAKMGNMISKKLLLQIIKKPISEESSSQSLEKEDIYPAQCLK